MNIHHCTYLIFYFIFSLFYICCQAENLTPTESKIFISNKKILNVVHKNNFPSKIGQDSSSKVTSKHKFAYFLRYIASKIDGNFYDNLMIVSKVTNQNKIVFFLQYITGSIAFALYLPFISKLYITNKKDNKTLFASKIDPIPYNNIKIISKVTIQHKIAIFLGYVMGSIAIALYLPIIVNILRIKSVEGISVATWISSLASFSLALIYPIKKKFALSTYVELIALHLQSFFIVGLICVYKNLLKEFFIGSFAFISCVSILIISPISPRLLSSIQIVRLILDGYSLLPQIILNFKTKSFKYSEITALLSAFGNGLRVITTLELVKDPLILTGYVIGLLSNIILLSQFIYFKKK